MAGNAKRWVLKNMVSPWSTQGFFSIDLNSPEILEVV